MPHTTVAARFEVEERVRGSRFLAVVAPADTPDAAAALLDEMRRRHPDASHHCSAWRVGEAMAFSDDGEPGGTAGRPMLSVLLKRELDHVAAVCVRWFGGTKLGAGGLARAYAGTVAKALDGAGQRRVFDMAWLRIRAPFAQADALHRTLDAWPHLAKEEPSYDAEGITVRVRVRAREAARLEAVLADVTAGAARAEPSPPAASGPPDASERS
ncbi:MAG: YigZ family protein [Trueperaceae bacterium]|nr:YigZ family protein [Trueperaceae bacterium]